VLLCFAGLGSLSPNKNQFGLWSIEPMSEHSSKGISLSPSPPPLFLVPLVHLVVIRCCFISYWISKKRQFIYLTWWTTFICPDVLNIGDFSGFAINQKNPPPQQEYLYLLLRSFPSFVGIHCGEQEWKFMFFFVRVMQCFKTV
jgi:hypothetical protein